MKRLSSHLAALLGLLALTACGARNELYAGEPEDAGASTDAAFDCPLGTEHRKGKDYCICRRLHPEPTTVECPATETCCEPFHITADVQPSVCVPAGDDICQPPHD